MEGVGSRLGRASSRYGGPATVFSGPVRKWKKQWVRLASSTSSSTTVSYQNNNNNNNSSRSSNSNGNGNNSNSNSNSNNASALILCRWTPISPMPEEPPRRKFRYTPIVVLEEQKKEDVEKVDDKAKTSKAHPLTKGTSPRSDDVYETSDTEGAFMEEIQAANKNRLDRQHSNTSNLNLDLGLKGHDEKHESDGENKEGKLGRVSSGGFWA